MSFSSILNAPGVNATNAATFSFPSELNGVYTGEGANWVPLARPYEVYLNIDGCSVYGENCGDAAYPPLTGELTYVAPVDCVHYLRGAVPTGRCYQFAEDYIGAGTQRELQFPFWYSYIVLSEQEDSTFFWTYMQGGLGVAWGYLSRSDNQAEMPVKHLSSFAGEQQMMMQYMSNATDETLDERRLFPKGAEFALRPQNNIFPAYLGGVWRSDKIENYIGDIGHDITITVDERGCSQYRLRPLICAEIKLPAIDSTRGLQYALRTECISSQAGPNPAGTCYMFMSVDSNARADTWDSDSLGFYTLSEQQDGDLWWSWNYGPISKAAGLLSR